MDLDELDDAWIEERADEVMREMVSTGAAADPHDFADLRRSAVRLIRHLRDLAVAAQLGSAAMELEDELFARRSTTG